jgi:hypothetical protein
MPKRKRKAKARKRIAKAGSREALIRLIEVERELVKRHGAAHDGQL